MHSNGGRGLVARPMRLAAGEKLRTVDERRGSAAFARRRSLGEGMVPGTSDVFFDGVLEDGPSQCGRHRRGRRLVRAPAAARYRGGSRHDGCIAQLVETFWSRARRPFSSVDVSNTARMRFGRWRPAPRSGKRYLGRHPQR